LGKSNDDAKLAKVRGKNISGEARGLVFMLRTLETFKEAEGKNRGRRPTGRLADG
jgi:hypothetical protein